jgi:hypothetical protein
MKTFMPLPSPYLCPIRHSSFIVIFLVAHLLQVLYSNNDCGLDLVLELFNLLLELVERDFVVLNDQVELELLDTETNSNQLGGTPDKTVLLDGEDVSLELIHVCVVICILLVCADFISGMMTYPKA